MPTHKYTHSSRKHQPISRSDGKVIGIIQGDTLRKNVRASIHQLRKPLAWAWDKKALKQAKALGVRGLEIYDPDSKATWSTSLTNFLNHSFSIDRNLSRQLALRLDSWTRSVEIRNQINYAPLQMEGAS